MTEQDNEDVGTTNSYEGWKAAIVASHGVTPETPGFVQRHNKFMTSPIARKDGVLLSARSMRANFLSEIEEFMKYHAEVGNELYLYTIQGIDGTEGGGYLFRAAVIDHQLTALKAKHEIE